MAVKGLHGLTPGREGGSVGLGAAEGLRLSVAVHVLTRPALLLYGGTAEGVHKVTPVGGRLWGVCNQWESGQVPKQYKRARGETPALKNLCSCLGNAGSQRVSMSAVDADCTYHCKDNTRLYGQNPGSSWLYVRVPLHSILPYLSKRPSSSTSRSSACQEMPSPPPGPAAAAATVPLCLVQ